MVCDNRKEICSSWDVQSSVIHRENYISRHFSVGRIEGEEILCGQIKDGSPKSDKLPRDVINEEMSVYRGCKGYCG